MTMPKFDPVAHMQVSVEEGVDTYFPRLHKPEKYNADWWRFDPLHSADQLTEAFEAGAASRDAEVNDWRSQAHRSQSEADNAVAECDQLRAELAAEQAKNVGLREALEYSIKQVPELATVPGISKALSTQSDTSALEAIVKKAGEKMRERCTDTCLRMIALRPDEGRLNESDDCYESIRALPAVTLEDLK